MSVRETLSAKVEKLEAENMRLIKENTVLNTRIAYLLETFKEFADKVTMLAKRP